MALLLPICALGVTVPLFLEPSTEPSPRTAAPVVFDDLPQLEYTYIEVNYLWTDSDVADDTIDGGEITGSLELPLNFFVQLTGSRQSGDADINSYRLGAGYHLPLGQRIDLFGILSYANVELDGSSNDFHDDGVAGELGVRFMLLPKLEVNGSAEWVNVNEDDYGLGAGARWYFLNRFSVGGRVESFDGDPSFSAGVRFEI